MRTILNHLRFTLVSASLALVLSGCSDAASPRPPDPLVQRLVDMGFSPDQIVDRGDYFIVEGDIRFLKEDLRDEYPTQEPGFPLPEFQWRTNNLVSGPNVQNIKVSISASLSASWAQAARQALVEWSGIAGTTIEFIETGPADIAVRSSSTLGTGVVAQATFPANGKPGPTIDVSTSFESFTASQKLLVIAHEFGHTIGFRHSNWQALGESANPYGAMLIGNTPQTDASSVMNGATGGNNWNGFSSWDVEAARVMYNQWPWLSVQMQPNNDRLLTWTSVTGAVSYQIHADYEYCVYEFGTPTCHSGGNASFSTTGTEYLDNVPPGGMTDDSCYATYQIWPVFQGGQGQLSNTPFRQGWVC